MKQFYYVERRRVCLACEHPFKTVELTIDDYARLVTGETYETEDDGETS